MFRRLDTSLALVLALLLGGCGPSELEAGQAILLAAIPITVIAFALQRFYTALWRPLVRLDMSWRKAGARVLTVLVLLSASSLLLRGWTRHLDDWLLMALGFVGASYASLFAIALRATATQRLRHLYPWAIALPWLVLYPAALFYALFGSSTVELSEFWQVIWIIPGWGGLIAGPVLLILVGEVVWRRVRLARRLKREEPEFPSARVHKQRKN